MRCYSEALTVDLKRQMRLPHRRQPLARISETSGLDICTLQAWCKSSRQASQDANESKVSPQEWRLQQKLRQSEGAGAEAAALLLVTKTMPSLW